MLKVVLVGTGGVGSVAALALESTGKVEVTMVARSIYDEVSKNGFEFDSVDYGQIKHWYPSHIVNSIEAANQFGPFDYIMVSTKNIPEVQRTEDVIRPLVTKGSTIVLVQNGIGGEELVMEAFPDSYVLGGISMIGSASYGGKVKHTGSDWLLLGTYDKRPEAQKSMEVLQEVYDSSKSKCEIYPNLKYRRWVKLVYNSAYNTTAALTGLDTGRLYFSSLKETVVRPAMKEVRIIAEKDVGEKLPDGIEEFMLSSDGGIYFEPSMLVDVKKNQPMELEVILGNPLRIAKRLGVEAPTLSMLYQLLRGKQFKVLEQRGILAVPKEPYSYDDPPIWTPEF